MACHTRTHTHTYVHPHKNTQCTQVMKGDTAHQHGEMRSEICDLLHTCVASLEVINNQDRHTLSNYCRATPAAAAIQIHVPNLIPILGQPSDSILPIKMKRECAEIPLFS